MTPQVSVIVPTYNRCELLRQTLEALAAQRFDRDGFEVIVSDDGSSDGTSDVVRSFVDRLPIRYHFWADRGFRAGAARNAGARLAAGPVLVFLDTGAIPGPDFVRAHLDAHRGTLAGAGPGRAVIGYAYGFNPFEPPPGLATMLRDLAPAEIVARTHDKPEFWDLRHTRYAEADFDLSRVLTPWLLFWTVNVSVRAADFWRVGGFDEDFRDWGCEDVELGYRLHRDGTALTVSRDAWVIESPHERDMTANLAESFRNIELFHDRHPHPAVELFWAFYGRGRHGPVEHEYEDVLAWAETVRGRDVRDEIEQAARDTTRGEHRCRIAVFGCGAKVPDRIGATVPDYRLVDFDADLLAAAVAPGAHPGCHGIGLRTPWADKSADLVIISSRMRGLWERWSEDLLAEAHRIGHAVRVAFT
jgi:glycosyltransferase involved in cell wall biosynthesis